MRLYRVRFKTFTVDYNGRRYYPVLLSEQLMSQAFSVAMEAIG